MGERLATPMRSCGERPPANTVNRFANTNLNAPIRMGPPYGVGMMRTGRPFRNQVPQPPSSMSGQHPPAHIAYRHRLFSSGLPPERPSVIYIDESCSSSSSSVSSDGEDEADKAILPDNNNSFTRMENPISSSATTTFASSSSSLPISSPFPVNSPRKASVRSSPNRLKKAVTPENKRNRKGTKIVGDSSRSYTMESSMVPPSPLTNSYVKQAIGASPLHQKLAVSSPCLPHPTPTVTSPCPLDPRPAVAFPRPLPQMKQENKSDSKGIDGNSAANAPIIIQSDGSDTDDATVGSQLVKRARISTTAVPFKQKHGHDSFKMMNIFPRPDERGELNDFIQYGMSMIDTEGILQKLSSVPSIGRPKRINQKMLYSQVKHGNLAKSIAFLKAGVNPSSSVKGEDGRTAMHIAASKGHLDILIFLTYKAGARRIDCSDDSGRTPLFAAVEKKHMDIAQLLVKGGANPKLKTREGMNLLHAAARKGSLLLVKWLVSLGIPINEQDDSGWTAVMWAAESDANAEVMEYLINIGALTDLVDKELNICLHWAAIAGSFECTRLLIIGNPDPLIDKKNKFGETPLHVAAKGNHFHVTQFLLLNGADHLIKNKNNHTALDVSPSESKIFHCIRIRLQVECTDERGPISTLLADISCGKERVPVSCVNEVDNEKFPNDFVYITQPVESSCVMVKSGLTTVSPCKCKEACHTGCKCIKLSEQQKLWYFDDGRLDIKIFEEESPVLYECTPLCSCWDYCSNRVVQKGIQYPLQVFKTVGKGWGLRTLAAIPAGSFILSYVGELITDEEAEKRNKDTYLFNLDLKKCGDEPNCMDALKYGNCARFINHGCDANMGAVKLFTSNRDISFPGVAFFACKDIKEREELSFHYGDSFWSIKNKNGMYCKCSSADCDYSE